MRVAHVSTTAPVWTESTPTRVSVSPGSQAVTAMKTSMNVSLNPARTMAAVQTKSMGERPYS